MADNRPAEARLLVTRRVIYNALRTDYPMAPEWDNYPEIGQHDWEVISKAVDEWRESRYGVDEAAFEAAYDYLDARADAE